MKMTESKLRRIIQGAILEWGDPFDSSSKYTAGNAKSVIVPDEDFTEDATDMANEAAYQANTVDGPKGRAAKKLFTDMMKERVAQEKANGVDAREIRKELNRIWKAVYR